ncbi:hypothetical protein ACVW00_000903 [Marmoricola sp. URHA0025 HA25]
MDRTTTIPDTATVVSGFLEAVQEGSVRDRELWTDDATLDATVPGWRFHRRGPDAIRAVYAGWFADPGSFEELERHPIPGGELVRYLLAWTEDGVPHTAHHLHLLQVEDGLIRADLVMCGGRWPAALMAEMEAADA